LEKIPTWMPVVAAALSDGQGRWLMHRRPAHKQHGGLWEFPGGKVEPYETPAESLIRELDEELGITVDPGALVPSVFAQDKGDSRIHPIVILLYIVRNWEGEPRAIEGEGIGWFTPAEILELEKPPLDVALAESLFASGAG
jgi:8-oxo-dGTP diphosphatase